MGLTKYILYIIIYKGPSVIWFLEIVVDFEAKFVVELSLGLSCKEAYKQHIIITMTIVQYLLRLVLGLERSRPERPSRTCIMRIHILFILILKIYLS